MRNLLFTFCALTVLNISAQVTINQLDSLGRKTGDWVWIPDSVDMFWPSDNICRNNGKGLDLFYISDSIKSKIQDTVITVYATFYQGKMYGKAIYLVDNKYPIAKANYRGGKRDGNVILYTGSWDEPYILMTFSEDKKEGFEIGFYPEGADVLFYTNDELIFEASLPWGKAFLLPYENGKVKDGKYIFQMYDNEYKILKYKNGEIVKSKHIQPNNTVLDQTRKKSERPYYWGYVMKLFTNQKETRFQRWIKRKF